MNIGFNNLTDEVIPRIKESLIVTKSLEGLGLQSTLLTSIGVSELAEAIENNTSLQVSLVLLKLVTSKINNYRK